MKTEVKLVQHFLNEATSELVRILDGADIRMNLMEMENEYLTIVAHTDGYQQRELTIKLKSGEGCAGKAFESKVIVQATLLNDIDSARDWNIPQPEQAKVRDTLKTVLSIPVFQLGFFDPVTKEGNVVAILNIDSDDLLASELANLAPSLFERYQFVLSRLLSFQTIKGKE
jgi:hypothetical protein